MKFMPLFATLLSTLVLVSHAKAEKVPELPLEAYASLPDMSRPDLSPDGKRLAFIKNMEGTLVLMVFDLEKRTNNPIIRSDNKEVFLDWFSWLNDTNLLIGARDVRRDGAIRYTVTRMQNADLSDGVKLTSALKLKESDKPPQFQDNIISMLPDDDIRVLMQLDLKQTNAPGVYRVNPTTGRYQRVLRGKSQISHWISDRQGNIRMGYGQEDGKAFYRLYSPDTNEWQPFAEYELFSADSISVKGFGKDPDILYFTAIHEGRDALFRQSLKGNNKPELIYADPKFDVQGSLVYSDSTGEVVGFAHSNAQDAVVYWDEDMLKLQRSLAAALPDSNNYVLDTSQDGNRYLVYHTSASEPGIYLLGDRKQGTLDYIGSRYDAINESNYAGKQAIRYKARDGLEIAGYLTVPLSRQDKEKLPTIILPHGGPHARDFANFDYWSELLANRGYLVLQPNFRGSSGYGYEFEMSAMQDWGGAMQDDLQDAANYLVQQGLADPERICIGGGSYGGYAALMAVVKHPETFKCAASFAGVSDLEKLVSRRIRHFTNKDLYRAQFGEDDEKLAAVSPVNAAKQINRPVLLVHGTDDASVFVSQSRDMASALESADKEVTYIELEDGDHHLSHQAHRVETLEAFVEFFDKNLKQ
ncbi:prolyl oligopeptidase family serine peptidase [Shewanella submarina]|uniref:Alpha/beta hydrolase family protein n=1 Tax=Shewanella submarina TaxID=2016376 RepID=A0ABV7GAG3_9GAMM|nr:alpha/beta fold hydrolase [Shewanella submarina]MCL1039334.1 prolyl oligopeptidase family serine peptidase [Shewanella submarina]